MATASAAPAAKGAGGTAVKPFLSKLYSMLEDPATAAIISWTVPGDAIIVHEPEAFAQQLLPLYFKHNNFSSFVRQLNTYGFNKTDPDAWVFGHPEFKRGAKEQIHLIQRKSSHKPASAKAAAAAAALTTYGEPAPFAPLAPVTGEPPGDATEVRRRRSSSARRPRAAHSTLARSRRRSSARPAATRLRCSGPASSHRRDRTCA